MSEMTPECILEIIKENQSLRDQLKYIKKELEEALDIIREKAAN